MARNNRSPHSRKQAGDSNAPMAVDLRLRWVTVAIAAGLLAALLIAPQLWLDDPLFGCVAIFSDSFRLVWPLDWLFLLALGGLLIPIVATRRPERWIRIWCAVFLARVVWDRIPWQPYFYQYFFMLVVLGWSLQPRSGRPRRNRRQEATEPNAVVNSLRVIMVSIYFWSGLSKFNHRFLERGPAVLFAPLLPESMVDFVTTVSWIIPIGETTIALGLMSARFRIPAVCAALLMHAGILAAIGPWGRDSNHVVWPWNVVMVAALLLLFWDARESGRVRLLGIGRRRIHQLILFAFVLAPGLSYAGLWPVYVSFRLYAATEQEAYFYVSEDALKRMPPDFQTQFSETQAKFAGRIRFSSWSEETLGAFAPPERRVYLHVARRFSRFAEAPNDFVVTILSPPDFLTGKREIEVLKHGDY